MKSSVKSFLQLILGLESYLLLFAVCRIFVSRLDRREAGLYEFISRLPEQPVVLDVGANIGVTATIIQKQRPAARLIAFEPLPVNLKTLKSVFRLFGIPATVVACAVGESATHIEMVLPEKDGVVLHGLGHLKSAQPDAPESGLSFDVEMISLDDSRQLWENRRVDAIKLDVENAEALVLSGAKHLLQTDRPMIYCELWDNDNRRKCLALAAEIGHPVRVLVKGKLELLDGTRHTADNFFLLPA